MTYGRNNLPGQELELGQSPQKPLHVTSATTQDPCPSRGGAVTVDLPTRGSGPTARSWCH